MTIFERYGTDANVRDAMRAAVGHPNQTVLLDDETVQWALLRALDRVNDDYCVVGIGTFPTVAGQQVYSPLPAAAYCFRRVYWPQGNSPGCEEVLVGLDSLLNLVDESGVRAASEPWQAYVAARHAAWSRYLSATSPGMGVHIVERSVYLTPVPSSVVSVVFSYCLPRYASYGLIADQWMEPFLIIAEHYLHERLSAGAGAVNDLAESDGGTSIRTLAPAHHKLLAERKLAQYNQRRPPIELPSTAP